MVIYVVLFRTASPPRGGGCTLTMAEPAAPNIRVKGTRRRPPAHVSARYKSVQFIFPLKRFKFKWPIKPARGQFVSA